jgi:site-specific DNA recombinase
MRGKLWRVSTISGVLSNPYYLGRVPFDGEVYDGHHEPIIDQKQYDLAQSILRARPARGRGRQPVGLHLFRKGMLRCGNCDEAMVPRTNGGYQMYYCNGRKLGKELCSTPHIRRADIDSAVYAYFERVGLDVEATRRQLEGVQSAGLARSRPCSRKPRRRNGRQPQRWSA